MQLEIGIQLNPALTDIRGLINFISYRRNSVVANIENKSKWAEGTKNRYLLYHAYIKEDAPGHLLIDQTKKIVQKIFFRESILKIFKFYFNLDQSQVCISNRLKVTASQRQLLF